MMDTNNENVTSNEEEYCSGMKWTDIKQFQHRYIVNIPRNLRKNVSVEAELPSPVFDPVQETDYHSYAELFKPRPKLDTRLAYYKKLYAKTNKSLLKKMVKESEYATLPQYVIDVAQGAFEDNEDHAWCYTGGTLDCLTFDNNTYAAKAGLHQTVQVADISEPSVSVCCELNEDTPVYSLKSASYDKDAFLAVRQKCKISLFHLSLRDDGLKAQLAWNNKTIGSSFVDIAFNEFKRSEFAAIDANHNLKVKDFTRNIGVGKYNFATDIRKLSDCFAQISYIDRNTVAFINRCCISILDLRSSKRKNLCLKTTWLKCDDLCTFSKNRNDANYMYVSSLHNLAKLDIRTLKCVDRVTHMLSTPPFISSCVETDNGEYICLSGQYINDKVLLHSSLDSLSIPRYIPNTKDTFTTASLTKRLNISQHLEDRLSLPTLGMKLYRNNASGDIVLYTLNSVGDIFRQKLLQTKPIHTDAVNRLVEWTNMLPYKPKALEATSICNLSNIMHTISAHFSEAKILAAFMKENHAQKRFEKEFCGLPKYLEGSVGESMNAIWDVDANITSDMTSTLASTSKVSEWLHSVP